MSAFSTLLRAGLLFCSVAGIPAAAQQYAPDQSAPAMDQGAPPSSPGQALPAGQQHQPRQQVHRFIERFRAANITGDGRLTLAQAQAGHLPMIARHFDAIDAQHKGYVTLQDIRTYRQHMRAARENGTGANRATE